MKNYIETKIVKAEPMEKDRKVGYRVKYPDGLRVGVQQMFLKKHIMSLIVKSL